MVTMRAEGKCRGLPHKIGGGTDLSCMCTYKDKRQLYASRAVFVSISMKVSEDV